MGVGDVFHEGSKTYNRTYLRSRCDLRLRTFLQPWLVWARAGQRIPDPLLRFLWVKMGGSERQLFRHLYPQITQTVQHICVVCGKKLSSHFLKRFANAWRASVGAPDEVCRSTTVRGAKSSHTLRAFLFTMRAGIVLLHWKRAPGSKYVHCRQV